MAGRKTLLLLAACLTAGCRQAPAPKPVAASPATEQKFAFKGKIVKVDREAKQAEIDHEEIPGYMAAMVMVYPIQDEKALAELEPGAEITATLLTRPGGIYFLQEIVIRKAAPKR